MRKSKREGVTKESKIQESEDGIAEAKVMSPELPWHIRAERQDVSKPCTALNGKEKDMYWM